MWWPVGLPAEHESIPSARSPIARPQPPFGQGFFIGRLIRLLGHPWLGVSQRTSAGSGSVMPLNMTAAERGDGWDPLPMGGILIEHYDYVH